MRNCDVRNANLNQRAVLISLCVSNDWKSISLSATLQAVITRFFSFLRKGVLQYLAPVIFYCLRRIYFSQSTQLQWVCSERVVVYVPRDNAQTWTHAFLLLKHFFTSTQTSREECNCNQCVCVPRDDAQTWTQAFLLLKHFFTSTQTSREECNCNQCVYVPRDNAQAWTQAFLLLKQFFTSTQTSREECNCN